MIKISSLRCGVLLKRPNIAYFVASVQNYSSQKMVKVETSTEHGFLTRVLMNNEKQRNSLGLDMIRDLQHAIDELDLNACRVLVIGSTSPKIFSSGHNLKEFVMKDSTESVHSEKVFKEFAKLCLVGNDKHKEEHI